MSQKIAFKDFHRKMVPFKEQTLEDLIRDQVNEWIRLNKVKILSVETLWERNSHVSVGVRVWYLQED
ncbi:hypothetical protein Thal_0826 [Thermocrinis albus DSM 14484]|uniref:Uncharacterized protein n=1 Tax=Thermocrinis albus (strain DSM 14484 / JCM 11386 / HI 11/12) TaxID=638303 RepID=D3SL29_THEAH|nr:hypothetical protein [Thermocrinis albus]ADC89459.1 hypothetical protein Thal_0826 [Thermocrinis albus DSM 14484]